MNPFNTSIYDLFYYLNTLNGLLFSLEGQLSSFEKLYRESLSEASLDISMIFSVASLAIRDLTEWTKIAKYYPTGAFSARGDEYFKLIRVLIARESAWTISQACEAFETFLKDVSATLLLENQYLAETNKVEKFESFKKNKNLRKIDLAFWRGYINYCYRENTEILKFLRKICPDISRGETKNNRAIDLTEWFAVVEQIRHGATHSKLEIPSSEMKDWSKTKREILNRYFPGIQTKKVNKLDITVKDATFCLELFSEYSFQIYKFLSISKGYDWEILQKNKE